MVELQAVYGVGYEEYFRDSLLSAQLPANIDDSVSLSQELI